MSRFAYIERLEEQNRRLFVALALIEYALEHGDPDAALRLAREEKSAGFTKRPVPTNPATLLKTESFN